MKHYDYVEGVDLGDGWTADLQWLSTGRNDVRVIGYMAVNSRFGCSLIWLPTDARPSIVPNSAKAEGYWLDLTARLTMWTRGVGLDLAAAYWIEERAKRSEPIFRDDCTNNDSLEADFNDDASDEA